MTTTIAARARLALGGLLAAACLAPAVAPSQASALPAVQKARDAGAVTAGAAPAAQSAWVNAARLKKTIDGDETSYSRPGVKGRKIWGDSPAGTGY